MAKTTQKIQKKNKTIKMDKSKLPKVHFWIIKIIGLTMISAVFLPIFYKSYPLTVFLFALYIIIGLYFIIVTRHHLPANIIILAYGIFFIGLALNFSGPPVSRFLLKDLKMIWADPIWDFKAKIIFTSQTVDKILWLLGVSFLLLSDIVALAEKATGLKMNIKRIFKFPVFKRIRR